MLDYALELQHRFENSACGEHRRERGQVFTPPQVARFMASLFGTIPHDYLLLDPGAGIGTLTAAFCERIGKLRSRRTVTAHVFENDPQLIPLLKRNLDNCKRVLSEADHTFNYILHVGDFILATSHGLNGQQLFSEDVFTTQFDGVIMNPPYFKLRKDSTHAKLMAKIVHGQPNIYAFFMALAARLLKQDGEIVAITPRSFCNGLYFRGFRHWYFDRVALDHIHIFQSRTETFKHSNVLQESIITKVHRLGTPSPTIAVTTSFGADLADGLQRSEVPASDIIDNSSGDHVIRIPEGDDDREIIRLVESFPVRFAETGLCISTGPVVLFRASEYLLADATDKTAVFLLHPHNVKPFATLWPSTKNGKPKAFKCCGGSLRLLVPTKNYVLMKRFSAKEEKRRLTAACFLAAEFPFPYVGIENHVNYVYHAQRGLTEDEVYGIATLLNSTLIDHYFRTISGSTQVNATEIRAMNFPDLKTLARIGKQARRNPEEAEAVVLNELGATGSLHGSFQWAEVPGAI
ncbi:MAG: Eco57I restriction-modification methylase domain-containing protein [Thermoguttaceae bacterium]|jgi:adenine-specific DNA-methyltransferase